MQAEPLLEQADLYISGAEGFHTFRIPSIVVTTRGTVLAFCEGRRDGRHDSGDIAMVLRRSEDDRQDLGPCRSSGTTRGTHAATPVPSSTGTQAPFGCS